MAGGCEIGGWITGGANTCGDGAGGGIGVSGAVATGGAAGVCCGIRGAATVGAGTLLAGGVVVSVAGVIERPAMK